MTRTTTTILMTTTTAAKTIILIKKEASPQESLPFMIICEVDELPLLLVDDGVAMKKFKNQKCTKWEPILLLSQVMPSLQFPSELHVKIRLVRPSSHCCVTI